MQFRFGVSFPISAVSHLSRAEISSNPRDFHDLSADAYSWLEQATRILGFASYLRKISLKKYFLGHLFGECCFLDCIALFSRPVSHLSLVFFFAFPLLFPYHHNSIVTFWILAFLISWRMHGMRLAGRLLFTLSHLDSLGNFSSCWCFQHAFDSFRLVAFCYRLSVMTKYFRGWCQCCPKSGGSVTLQHSQKKPDGDICGIDCTPVLLVILLDVGNSFIFSSPTQLSY